jgi:hypothetical protein
MIELIPFVSEYPETHLPHICGIPGVDRFLCRECREYVPWEGIFKLIEKDIEKAEKMPENTAEQRKKKKDKLEALFAERRRERRLKETCLGQNSPRYQKSLSQPP